MHIKAIVKTVFNWLQPEWYQTPDNNIDMANRFENYVLTEELEASWEKMRAAKKLIAEYEYFKAAREEGLLITKKERQQRAEATYNLWLDCNFIQKGEIVPGVLEYMTDLINS